MQKTICETRYLKPVISTFNSFYIKLKGNVDAQDKPFSYITTVKNKKLGVQRF